MIDNDPNEYEVDPYRHSRFVNKVNAVTPLITLAAAFACIAFGALKPSLWEKDGFTFALGSLIGNSAAGAYTQKDDNG